MLNKFFAIGVGGFELSDRGYARTTDETLIRRSESGPWSRSLFGESRLQIRHATSHAVSSVEPASRRGTSEPLDRFSLKNLLALLIS